LPSLSCPLSLFVLPRSHPSLSLSSFVHVPSPPHIYTLSLHDALPISSTSWCRRGGTSRTDRSRLFSPSRRPAPQSPGAAPAERPDRKSTRLNSSHVSISYAVFCLKKKNHWAAARP